MRLPRTLTVRAFTLVELLIVMAIISVLAAILLPAIFSIPERARKAQTAALLATVTNALEQYADDHGRFPTLRPGAVMDDEQQFTCLFLHLNGDPTDGYGGKTLYLDLRGDQVVGGLSRTAGRGAEVEMELPLGTIVDAWGNGLRYLELRSVRSTSQPQTARNRRTYDLVSAGPDGEFGTEDDCANYTAE